jgi:integrase
LAEALNANWAQIDLANKSWRIPASIAKSKRSRSVPLSEAVLDVLNQTGTKDGPVFVSTKTKGPLKQVHKVWQRLRVAAGMPKLRIHDLRRSFASFLVNAGRSLYEVQELLGHADSRTTTRYAHLSRERLQEAVEVVPRVRLDVNNATRQQQL